MGDMTVEEQVRAAQNPQEALLAVARGLDVLLAQRVVVEAADPWGAWAPLPERLWPEHARTQITVTEDAAEIVLAPPSEEKMERRRQFERQFLRLHEHLEGDEDWTEAYARGGPQWLYYGNLELVKTFPKPVLAAMINDVEETSPEEAHEIGRDLLKFAGETGPGHVAMMIGEGQLG